MPVYNAIASVPVKDLKSACQWYERFLGRPPDSKPMSDLAEWKFEQGGWFQLYQLPEQAGRGSVTFVVGRLEQHVQDLEHCTLARRDAMKVVLLEDPDGNRIAMAEAVDPSSGGDL